MTDSISADMRFSHDLFEELNRDWRGAGPKEGMDRPGYSLQENAAIAAVHRAAITLGMKAHTDLAGNYFFSYKGCDSYLPVQIFGSHLDAVPHGGRYDGPAGVVAGMAVCEEFFRNNIRPPQDIIVAVWRNEESSGFPFAIGSKLAVGGWYNQDVLQLTRKSDGKTLEQAMQSVGVATTWLSHYLDGKQPLLPLDQIGNYTELHIEQGPGLARRAHKLLAQGKEDEVALVAVAKHIRGNFRVELVFRGVAGHMGTVEQDIRQNAALAISEFNVRANKKFAKIKRQGHDLVWGPSLLTTGQNASKSTIPDYCMTYWDVRTTESKLLPQIENILYGAADKAAKTHGMVFNWAKTEMTSTPPVAIKKSMQQHLHRAAKCEGLKLPEIASGAGHDAGILALAGVHSGMLLLAHEGHSHRPDETMGLTPIDPPFTDKGPYAQGVRIMSRLALMSATPGEESPKRSNKTFPQALMERGAREVSP